MKIIPFEKYEIRINRPSTEVVEIIGQNSEPWRLSYVFGARTKPFLGSVDNNTFKIYRAIRYQNSFLPILDGVIENRGNESKLLITMRMPHFTSIFMLFWLGGTLLMALSGDENFRTPVSFVPWGLFLFGYVLMQGGFWLEVPRAKQLLEETLGESS